MKVPEAILHAPSLGPGAGTRRLIASSVPALAGCGVLLELLLVTGLLLPMSLRRYPEVVRAPDGFARVLGDDAAGAARTTLLILALFAVFGVALWLASRLRGSGARWFVLAGSAVFAVTLLPLNPLGAQDVYHNVLDARIFWLHHANPTQQPPLAFPYDRLAAFVPSWRDTPSAYGPLWYLLAGLPIPVAGDGLWANVIGQKLLVGGFLLGLTWLVMQTAERVRPGSGAAAGVLVGWNPLLQFEAAGNAHNDVVMAFFAVAALYALTRRWWLAVFPLLALAVASKEIMALLGPILLVYLLRREEVSRRSIALSMILGAALVVVLYLPFLAGKQTLAGLSREADHVTSSPGALIYLIVQTSIDVRWQVILGAMKLAAWPVFLLGYASLLRAVLRRPTPETAFTTAFWAMLLLLALLTWWFMPWYLFWLAPLAAACAGRRPMALAAVFSGCAMLSYVPHFWLARNDALLREAATALTGFAVPLGLTLALALGRRSQAPFRRRARDCSTEFSP